MNEAALPALDPERQAIRELVRGASVELSARDRATPDAYQALLPRGTAIYINFAPGDSYHGSVDAAVRIRRAGFRPVPHVAARYLAGPTQLADFLARAQGEAGIDDVLLIAGDIDQPAGAFRSSLDLIETGLLEKHGIRRIGIAGYPEGHPKIGKAELDTALIGKLAQARQAGLATRIVTQFAFEAGPILSWIRHLRASGVDVPVHVGLAGPATIAALVKFALRCGIGNSIGMMLKHKTSVTRLLTESGSERVIHGLTQGEIASLGLHDLHFFAFGGVTRTCKWLGAIERGDFTLTDDDSGFEVTR
jgi:methylenetetrahydrofolate reductase (NADPH)